MEGDEMDWYTLMKFLHVLAAMIWLGGGFTLIILAARAQRDPDPAALIRFADTTMPLGNLLFVPAALLVLLSGLAMAWFWTGFSDAWIVLALAGYATSLSLGAVIVKPRSDRLAAKVKQEGPTPATAAATANLLRIGRFDYTIMILVVVDMVFKPTWQDLPLLLGMAIVAVLGAALFLMPRRQSQLAAA
jgi:uncharacterized membrane protein